MTEQWQKLKDTITEMRDNDGTGTQQEVCKFLVNYMDILEKQMQEPCEMTAEEYRQRMIQAFHNANTDELIALCVFPTEKEFEHLEWLLKTHYKKEPCEDAISRQTVLDKKELVELEDGQSFYCISPEDVEALQPVTPQPKSEDIAKAFQMGLAIGFGERYDELDRVIDEIKKVITPQPKKEYEDKVNSKSLCDSCINDDCIFQTGIFRKHCDFYKSESKKYTGFLRYVDIYNEFCKKFPDIEVEDYRPASEIYIPQLSGGIPNAIIVWIKDGSKVIYIAESEDGNETT